MELENVPSLIKRFEKIEDTNAIAEKVKKACILVEGVAREKAPRNTGTLRRSIESNVEIENDKIIGTVGSTESYAPYIEYGTGLFAEQGNGRNTPWSYEDDSGNWHTTIGQAPQPFLRPALIEKKEEILEELGECLK